MKISAIRQQKKLKDRYSVYVDGAYSFSLSESALLESKLAGGQEITADELSTYKRMAVDDKAYGNALRYVAMRPRSLGELHDYFRRKKVEEPVAKQIISRLTNIGLLNDEVFARSWVESRRLLKPVSQRRLVQELKQKRVNEDIISKVLQADPSDELSVLAVLVAKKRQQSKYQDNGKLMQYLARQGFSYDDIKQVLQSTNDSTN